jgi:hypothetical protein
MVTRASHERLMDLIALYHDTLGTLVNATGMPPALLQVHAGMAIYLGCLLMMGTRRGSLAAVGLCVALAVVNEALNRLHLGQWNWHDTTRDLVMVLLWPTACYAVSTARRWAWNERRRQRANEQLLHLYDYRPLSDNAPLAGSAPTASARGAR